MSNFNRVNQLAARNWLLDAVVALGGFFAILSGAYFLFLPIGGYQGGRNSLYGITILFDRHTWEELHVLTGVIFVLVAILHIALHWSWISGMTRKIMAALFRKGNRLSRQSRWNAMIDFSIGISFIISSVSGIAFLVEPVLQSVFSIGLRFNERLWDLVHTWSSVIMVIGIFLHLAIHWGWIKAITGRMLSSSRKTQLAEKGAK